MEKKDDESWPYQALLNRNSIVQERAVLRHVIVQFQDKQLNPEISRVLRGIKAGRQEDAA